MAKQKEIIQAIVDASIALIPTPEGSNGLSAYQLAVEGGYTGTVEEWLLSLHGEDGDDGITQDISNLVVKETGKSLVPDTEIAKLSTTPVITVSATEPQNPIVGQIWIDIS